MARCCRKKKLHDAAREERFTETEAFLQIAAQRLKQQGASEMQWIEDQLRIALLKDGQSLLQAMLSDSALHVAGDAANKGERTFEGRTRRVESLFGPIELRRRYYHRHSGGRYPLDRALGLIGDCTPSLARLMTRAGAQSPFEQASADLAAYASVVIPARQIQRLIQSVGPQMRSTLRRLPRPQPPASIPVLYLQFDGTGIPMHKSQLLGVRGRGPDGQAQTREVKLGCAFTQTTTGPDNEPQRDESSTSYVASMLRAGEFGILMGAEAQRRSIDRAQKVVILGDGAAWIWELARVQFPGALQILDFYHATEYLAQLAGLIHPAGSPAFLTLFGRWRHDLKTSSLSDILAQARSHLGPLSLSPEDDQKAQSALGYFDNNLLRMDYPNFISQGFFIGSGVVEAGCKTVVGQRLKHSGMFWGKTGAQNILTVRCALQSQNRFDDFWKALSQAA
jgi:hypothetical protein